MLIAGSRLLKTSDCVAPVRFRGIRTQWRLLLSGEVLRCYQDRGMEPSVYVQQLPRVVPPNPFTMMCRSGAWKIRLALVC